MVGLQRWIDEFTEEGGSTERALVIIGWFCNTDCVISYYVILTTYLAANKIDLASAVDLTDVRIWAEQKGFKFVKSSAATAEGVSGKKHILLDAVVSLFICDFRNIRAGCICFNGRDTWPC